MSLCPNLQNQGPARWKWTRYSPLIEGSGKKERERPKWDPYWRVTSHDSVNSITNSLISGLLSYLQITPHALAHGNADDANAASGEIFIPLMWCLELHCLHAAHMSRPLVSVIFTIWFLPTRFVYLRNTASS